MKQRTRNDYLAITLISIIVGAALLATHTGPWFARHYMQISLSAPLIFGVVLYARAVWLWLYRMTRPGAHYTASERRGVMVRSGVMAAAVATYLQLLWLLWRQLPGWWVSSLGW